MEGCGIERGQVCTASCNLFDCCLIIIVENQIGAHRCIVVIN